MKEHAKHHRKRNRMKSPPCFSEEAQGRPGRIHLPVAMVCNIQCRYCTRKCRLLL
jgi:hypothetical protein